MPLGYRDPSPALWAPRPPSFGSGDTAGAPHRDGILRRCVAVALLVLLAVRGPAPADAQTTAPAPGAVSGGWSFDPPHAVLPPPVRNTGWARGSIDRYILARLEAQGFSPARDADRATLCRRLYFDLTGLPPEPAALESFLRDTAPGATERLVDRLLASPRFGEHWARHWFDIVRFAESVTLRGFIFREAWRYRDYVIECFNRDVPFDQFLRAQIAGDLLPAAGPEERRRNIAATTFLMLGNTNLEEQDKAQLEMDVIDEQLDVIGKALLGQTIACARCHDHKFDPIPTRDYYALAGILRNVAALKHDNVSAWTEVPLPVDPATEALLAAHERKVAALQSALASAKSKSKAASGSPPANVPASAFPGIVVDSAVARRVGEWTLSQHTTPYIGDGYLHDGNTRKGEKTLSFHPELPRPGRYEVRLAYTAAENRSSEVPATIYHAEGETTVRVDERARPPIDGRFVSLGTYRFETSGFAQVLISNEGTEGHVIADAVQFLAEFSEPTAAPARSVPGSNGPASPMAEVKSLEDELKALQRTGPKRPMAMSVLERTNITDAPIHRRGSVHRLGEVAPRGFLTAVTARSHIEMPNHESGRRQLADWIASAGNPLTSRVFVNRAWLWLWGEGLVRTPDNFGATGQRPTHPELLDHLAVRFASPIGDSPGTAGLGWSVKSLIREIVLSRAYQMDSAASPGAVRNDSENRLLSHTFRRRLTAEQIRDAMLATAGELRYDPPRGPTFPADRSADFDYASPARWRSAYIPVFRNALPDVFTAFDFAPPSYVTGKREASTVPAQALFLMNHPFVLEQSTATARRLLGGPTPGSPNTAPVGPAETWERTLDRAYLLALSRPPSAAERSVAQRHFHGRRDTVDAWTEFVHALFGSVAFRYLD